MSYALSEIPGWSFGNIRFFISHGAGRCIKRKKMFHGIFFIFVHKNINRYVFQKIKIGPLEDFLKRPKIWTGWQFFRPFCQKADLTSGQNIPSPKTDYKNLFSSRSHKSLKFGPISHNGDIKRDDSPQVQWFFSNQLLGSQVC